MDLEKRIDLYKSDYLFHIDFKEKIYARMVLFSVFITACITSNFTMQDTLMKLNCSQMTIVFILWGISSLILIFVIINFVCITSLKSDEWVNSNAEMETYRETLRNHFISNCTNTPSNDDVEKYVNEQFSIYLIDQYSSCSTILNENNIFRQKRLSHLAVATYILLVLTFIISLFFIFQKFNGEQNVSKPTNPTTTTTTTNTSNKR